MKNATLLGYAYVAPLHQKLQCCDLFPDSRKSLPVLEKKIVVVRHDGSGSMTLGEFTACTYLVTCVSCAGPPNTNTNDVL